MITSDPTQINEILNHPDIIQGHFPEGGATRLDATPSFNRGGCAAVGEGYGFMFDPISTGVYEVHSSVLPEYREHSVQFARKSLCELFTSTDCMEMVTRVKDNRPAYRLATSVGMKKLFERDGYVFLGIGIFEWAARRGDFSQMAKEMVDAGQPGKAVWFYNTWARLVGVPLATNEDDIKEFE